jgi:hypothetical protein
MFDNNNLFFLCTGYDEPDRRDQCWRYWRIPGESEGKTPEAFRIRLETSFFCGSGTVTFAALLLELA